MHFLVTLAISLGKGILLGGSVYLLGWYMDRTISRESHDIVKHDKKTYYMAQKYVLINLLIISPITFMIVDISLLNHDIAFSFFRFTGLIMIQNLGYYLIHREMHQNKKLYWIHMFHHKYDTITVPSIANAVTHYEFILAYLIPMIAGASFIKPTELEFLTSVGLISVFNLLIHTYELNKVEWCPGFVSPTQHIAHHKERNIHYAAPLLNVDEYMYYVSQYILKNKNV
jgi:sterol desaturase/sphingolipid hydroxylase (fatty acid hydroxylase superfamily)